MFVSGFMICSDEVNLNISPETAARVAAPKKTILDDLKNPKTFFRELTKKKKE